MWRLAEDTINAADLDALADWLRTNPRMTQGELVRRFEDEWASWVGTRNAVLVSSGTTANFALVAVLSQRWNKSRPMRIGVSAVTWATNVTPSMLLGHELVVFDVGLANFGVDREHVLEALRARRIDVLFVTHLLGFPALDDELLLEAERTGVTVIEDCCEAHGATLGQRQVGSLGLGGTFSFYFGHHMSTIEGGMITTSDDGLAEELRLFRGHGLAREARDPAPILARAPEVDPRFFFAMPGLNFRSAEPNAFLGLRQIKRLDERIRRRNENLALFLDSLPVGIASDFERAGVSSFALPILLDDPAHRDALVAHLDQFGVESRPIVAGNLLRQPFFDKASHTVFGGAAPVADLIHEAGVYVGNGPHVSLEQVENLARSLDTVVGS